MEYQERGHLDEESDNEEDAITDWQLQFSGEESDSSEDEIDYGDESEDGETEEDEETALGLAGPSTSSPERQGTRRVAKRQMVSGKAAKRQRTGRDVKAVPLRIITLKLNCTVPGCKKKVKSKSAMNRHLLLKHQLKEYRCLVAPCHGQVSTSFATRVQLNDHRRQVHGSLTEWTCKCAKKYNSYYNVSLHYWLNHELGTFTCSKEGCPVQSTTTRVKVLSHQYHHREARYQCSVNGCDQSFKKKSGLDRHLLTHSGDRPFPCLVCDKSFTQKCDLTRHLRIHRNDKCFRCTWPQCTAYSAIQQSQVIGHIRTKHFKVPRTKKAQLAAGIVDDRDARDYLAKN